MTRLACTSVCSDGKQTILHAAHTAYGDEASHSDFLGLEASIDQLPPRSSIIGSLRSRPGPWVWH